MTIQEIAVMLDAIIRSGDHKLEKSVQFAFASDLMSDVLTLKKENVLLITGLANIQVIRTAEMADIDCVIVARNKQVTEEMLEIARENDLVVLACRYSVFKTSGMLYEAGIQPVF